MRALLAAACLLLLAALPCHASWAAGPACCAGCAYDNALRCCCPRRPARTVWVRRTATARRTATRVVSRTVTVTAGAAPFLAGRGFAFGFDEPAGEPAGEAAEEQAEEQAGDAADEAADELPAGTALPALFARHECPVCPVSKLAPGSPGRPCCPPRRTVTRTSVSTRTRTATVVRTSTVRRTATAKAPPAPAVVTIDGRLFADADGDGLFSPPRERPRPFDPVLLLLLPSLRRRADPAVLNETTTDALGLFSLSAALLPGQVAGVARGRERGRVLFRAQHLFVGGGDDVGDGAQHLVHALEFDAFRDLGDSDCHLVHGI
ncbi:hypothetical protein DFJ74DRAFT_772674 [Hyaloraphidium curvatum]|nr:hypothetical protein DFJ74DRAFT_772674 [Hyaloraphidium curvatum]